MKTFPYDYSDQELNDEVNKLVQQMANEGYQINAVLHRSPLIELAQNELQRRLNKESTQSLSALAKITEENAQTSRRDSHKATWLSYVAIGIAIIGLIVQVTIAITTARSDKNWQLQELKQLKELNDNFK